MDGGKPTASQPDEDRDSVVRVRAASTSGSGGVDPVEIGAASVVPVSSVRNLGVRIDGDVTMASHVAATVSACFAALRRIASVRRSLPRHALLTLIRALVISKIYY
jgi:hypothetical protein